LSIILVLRDSNWLRYEKIHKKSIKAHAIKYPFTIYCSPKELSLPHTINFIYFILPICDNIKHSPNNVPYHQFFTIQRRVNLFSPAPFTNFMPQPQQQQRSIGIDKTFCIYNDVSDLKTVTLNVANEFHKKELMCHVLG